MNRNQLQSQEALKAVIPTFRRIFSAPKRTIFGKIPKIVTKALGSIADNLREKAQDCHEGAQISTFERLREKSLSAPNTAMRKQLRECRAEDSEIPFDAYNSVRKQATDMIRLPSQHDRLSYSLTFAKSVRICEGQKAEHLRENLEDAHEGSQMR